MSAQIHHNSHSKAVLRGQWQRCSKLTVDGNLVGSLCASKRNFNEEIRANSEREPDFFRLRVLGELCLSEIAVIVPGRLWNAPFCGIGPCSNRSSDAGCPN